MNNFCCHICGRWTRELLNGNGEVFDELPTIPVLFNRIQLNFHDEHVTFDEVAFVELINDKCPTIDFIFQIDENRGHSIFDVLLKNKDRKFGVYPLFDVSGGRGMSPDEWPSYIKDANYCGYAGGIGPDNIKEEIEKIKSLIEPTEQIWIDMETKVRSNNDEQFDIDKVTDCLKISEPYIMK